LAKDIRLTRDIPAGEIVRRMDVVLDEGSEAMRVRRAAEELAG
jgi:predicted homoserine dehydrogenase-like protein